MPRNKLLAAVAAFAMTLSLANFVPVRADDKKSESTTKEQKGAVDIAPVGTMTRYERLVGELIPDNLRKIELYKKSDPKLAKQWEDKLKERRALEAKLLAAIREMVAKDLIEENAKLRAKLDAIKAPKPAEENKGAGKAREDSSEKPKKDGD